MIGTNNRIQQGYIDIWTFFPEKYVMEKELAGKNVNMTSKINFKV